MHHDPIAYTFEADTHCPPCTEQRFGLVWRVRDWDNLSGPMKRFTDEAKAEEYANSIGLTTHGPFIAEGCTDNEGNEVGAIFSWDETESPLVCGSCGETIH